MTNIILFDAEKATRYIEQALIGFINDPADSDFQRGYLAALLAIYEEGLGKGVGDSRLKNLREMARCYGGDERMDDITYFPPATLEGYNPVLEAVRWQGRAQDFQAKLKTKDLELQDFRQEVSDAVSKAIRFCKDGRPASAAGAIGAFVIPAPKPDPLVDVMEKLGWYNALTDADDFRAALDALGFEIREKNDDRR